MILVGVFIGYLFRSLLFSYFVGSTSKVEKLNLFILTSSMIQFSLYMIPESIISRNSLLSIALSILGMYILLFAFNHKLNFSDINNTLFYRGLIILCSSIHLLIRPEAYRFTSFTYQDIHILITLIVQLILTVLLLKFQDQYSNNLSIKAWKYILLNEIITIIMIAYASTSLLNERMDNSMWILLLLGSANFISTKVLLNKIGQINEERIGEEKNKELERIIRERESNIKHIKNEIQTLDHRMYYITHMGKKLIEEGKYDEAKELLKSQEKNIMKYDTLLETGNSAFDMALGLKFYDLKMGEIDFNNAVSISQNSFYNSPVFIDFMLSILDVFSTASYLNMNIIENPGIVRVKIIYKDCEYDYDTVLNFIEEKRKDLHFVYRIEENTFSFVFNLA